MTGRRRGGSRAGPRSAQDGQDRELRQQGEFRGEQHPLPQSECGVEALRSGGRLAEQEHTQYDGGDGDADPQDRPVPGQGTEARSHQRRRARQAEEDHARRVAVDLRRQRDRRAGIGGEHRDQHRACHRQPQRRHEQRPAGQSVAAQPEHDAGAGDRDAQHARVEQPAAALQEDVVGQGRRHRVDLSHAREVQQHHRQQRQRDAGRAEQRGHVAGGIAGGSTGGNNRRSTRSCPGSNRDGRHAHNARATRAREPSGTLPIRSWSYPYPASGCGPDPVHSGPVGLE